MTDKILSNKITPKQITGTFAVSSRESSPLWQLRWRRAASPRPEKVTSGQTAVSAGAAGRCYRRRRRRHRRYCCYCCWSSPPATRRGTNAAPWHTPDTKHRLYIRRHFIASLSRLRYSGAPPPPPPEPRTLTLLTLHTRTDQHRFTRSHMWHSVSPRPHRTR